MNEVCRALDAGLTPDQIAALLSQGFKYTWETARAYVFDSSLRCLPPVPSP